jgi:hypothetical protein
MSTQSVKDGVREKYGNRGRTTIRVTAETTTGVIVMANARPCLGRGPGSDGPKDATSQKMIHAIATRTREG